MDLKKEPINLTLSKEEYFNRAKKWVIENAGGSLKQAEDFAIEVTDEYYKNEEIHQGWLEYFGEN